MLHRLFCGGSDRAADRWREDYRIDGVEGLDLHHLYRAMAWLGEELPEDQQDGATPFAPRCVKDVMEEDLFACRRDLLTTLDVVFMDTTSLYFEGAGGHTLGRRGFSKDHRPDLNQMILAVLLDGDGRPVCTEMWPGNTADVNSLIPAIDRLQSRFRINRVCVVADRGMISAEAIAELEARGLIYVLGVRERTDKLVRELVLDDPAPFVPFVLMKPRREVDYEAKAVKLAGRRYIVCRNLDEMSKDAANRATIVAALERQLKKGDKSLVGNKGYRRFLSPRRATASPSTAPRSRRTPSSTACSCCRPTRISRRWRRCSSTNSCGPWSGRSARPRACSRRGRSITNWMRRSAATSPAASSRSF